MQRLSYQRETAVEPAAVVKFAMTSARSGDLH